MTKDKYSDNEIIRIDYFYNLFVSRKRLFFPSMFLFPTNTRNKKIPVDFQLFKRIIQKYFEIYFNELYFNDTPKYFPLSGKIKKAKGSNFFVNSKKKVRRLGRSLTWIWYDRPSISFCSNVKLIKLKGSTSRVGLLDKKYKEQKDIELLPSANSALMELVNNNKMFRNG